MKYSEELAERFVKDYNIPIQITYSRYFWYFLELYEDDYSSYTKFESLIKEIKEKYNSDEDMFLKEYYKVRNEIIETINNSQSYQNFNNMDMNVFNKNKNYGISKNDVFKENNIGKNFLSIDLTKANFQALKFVDKNIVLGCENYEDLISKFTDSEYIKGSKYLRQVIFGKLNPSRHITVEKHITCLIMETLSNKGYLSELTPVSISNDEIVFEFNEKIFQYIKNNEELLSYTKIIHDLIYDKLDGIETKVIPFSLRGIKFENEQTGQKSTFFEIENLITFKRKLKCVPVVYFAQVYKFMKNKPIVNLDKLFVYENSLAEFKNNFNIYKF